MNPDSGIHLFPFIRSSLYNKHAVQRIGILSIDYVRSIIYDDPSIAANQYKISKVSKRRVKVFLKKGRSCVMCGREGTFFALERHVEHCKSNAWILNLYASEYGFAPGDDHEILMTIDHIIPLSRGGHPKHQDNMQTMCLHCNNFKASKAKFWKDINFEKVKHNNRIFRVPTNNPIRKEVPQ